MSEERREFFRIADEVVLDYREIGEHEVDSLIARIKTDVPDRFTAASSFAATSRQMAHIMYKIQNQSPDLARCLHTIDQKLNTLAQLFVSEEMHVRENASREVNLSGGGMAFRAQHELKVGSLLELRIVLLPTMVGILSVSRVVHCQHQEDGNRQFPWQIAVSYEHLRESDRELLVRHIMTKETERLRAGRAEND